MEATPTAPRLRLVQTSFARLSSGFRIPERTGDRELMAVSDALQQRLADRRLRIVPPNADSRLIADVPPNADSRLIADVPPNVGPHAASPRSAAFRARPLGRHADLEFPAVGPSDRGSGSASGERPLGPVLGRMHRLAAAVEGSLPGGAAERDLGALLGDLRRQAESSRSESAQPRDAATDVGRSGNVVVAASRMQRLMGAIARARALEGNVAGASSDPDVVLRAEEQLMLARAQSLLEEGVSRFTQSPTRPRLRTILN